MSYSQFIPGSHDLPYGLFDQVARECADTDILVHVGLGLGRALCYQTEALTAFDKRPKLYGFSLFGIPDAPSDGEGFSGLTPWGESVERWLARTGGPTAIVDHFINYLSHCPTADRITDWAQFPPHLIAGAFKDDEVAFAFLDASVQRENMLRDARAWLPKIAPKGHLAIQGPWAKETVRQLIGDVWTWQATPDTWVITNMPPIATGWSTPTT